MSSITLKNISKVYDGDVTAVSDFSLEIPDKEFVVLVGPSGCGKSTTLRMIAGLEEITSGELYIGDNLVNDVEPKDRDIAMVFQNYALYPHMTVYKNMAFGLTLRKIPKDEIKKRVLEVARVLDIEPLLERRPKALSGGQRQRVALGRAMVRNPAVFLLDEPLSNLDAKLRTSMRTELIRLHKSLQTTFVYVTHDQTEAMTMGDRIVVMKDGFILQADTPQKLFDSPNNMFVAGFIGSPQMNFFEGNLQMDDKGYYFEINSDRHYFPDNKIDEKMKEYIGKDVVLGIRPEDIHSDENSFSDTNNSVIDATIEVSELMGSEVYLYLKYGEDPLMARVPTSTLSDSKAELKVAFDMNKTHLFDKETEQAIIN
jgi:ABC-type sugar transport systems, ATPase components